MVSHRASAASASTTATTSIIVVVPGTIAVDDQLFLCVTARDNSGSLPVVTDDDSGGNTWRLIGGNTAGSATLWWKRATTNTALSTITVSNGVGSMAAGVSAYFDADLSAQPYASVQVSSNASGTESVAGFTPSAADSMICLAVYNISNDEAVTSPSTTDPGALTNRFENLSTGGNDCAVNHSSAAQVGGPTVTGNFTWSQTNQTTATIVWEVRDSGASPLTSAARTTQEAIYALAGGTGTTRVTQVPILYLSPVPAPARVTQVPILVLGEVAVGPRLTQAPVLILARSVPCLTRWCQCWSIIRSDGTFFGFTDHDESVTFNGRTYSPCKSLMASANELGALIGNVGSLELTGIITDDSITEVDLLEGKFDGSELEIWMVPWNSGSTEVPFRLTAGITGSCSQGVLAFTMEVLTAGAKLQQQSLLKSYTPQCRFTLGDDRCTVDLGPLTVTGAVTAAYNPLAFNQANRRFFIDSSRAEDERYFELGTLTWLTGQNAGLSSEIKSFSSGTFSLWNPSIYPIRIGDTYSAVPGCDLIKSTCISKFNNVINFGGFDQIPGQDAMNQSPNTKSVSSGET